jgi:hypothetical protein
LCSTRTCETLVRPFLYCQYVFEEFLQEVKSEWYHLVETDKRFWCSILIGMLPEEMGDIALDIITQGILLKTKHLSFYDFLKFLKYVLHLRVT